MFEILAHLRYPIEKFIPFLARFREQVYEHFILSISKSNMKLKQKFHGGNNNRQVNVLDHLISQNML